MNNDLSLRINKFKRIREEVLFEKFGKYNFFVGKNNSGKSSVLNAITLINDGANARKFCQNGTFVELKYNNKIQKLVWNEHDPNKTSNDMNINPYICSIGDDLNGMGSNNNSQNVLNKKILNVNNKELFEELNSILKFLEIEKISADKIFATKDMWSKDLGKLVFKQESIEIETHYLADGIKRMYWLASIIKNFITRGINKLGPIFIVIEEPENNLNPHLQKKLPQLFNYAESGIDPSLNLYYFISTHSPFIIASSTILKDHKVYLLDDGMPISINDSDLSWTKTNITTGYNGHSCSYVVSNMLGCEITDIGYPINYCIIEEYSLQIILNNLKSKGIISDYIFLSASGSSNIEKYSDTMQYLRELNILLKCNPFYYNKFIIVVDNYDKHSDKERRILDNIKNSIGERFIKLKKDSIEEYYINLSPEISKEYFNEKNLLENHKESGIVKGNYAERISQLIKNENDFKILFENELNLLLLN